MSVKAKAKPKFKVGEHPPKAPYLNANKQVVPGVTSILGRFKNSTGLLFWAYKKGKEDGLAGKEFAKLYDDTKALDAGTAAHTLVENYIKSLEWRLGDDGVYVATLEEEFIVDAETGATEKRVVTKRIELIGEDEAVSQGMSAFETFRKWQRMTRLEIKYVETELVSEEHQYGGKIDAIGVVEDELVMCDWKTSKDVYLDHWLQLGGYSALWQENYPQLPLLGGFHLLQFTKEGGHFSHHYRPSLDNERKAFLTLAKAHAEIKECEKKK